MVYGIPWSGSGRGEDEPPGNLCIHLIAFMPGNDSEKNGWDGTLSVIPSSLALAGPHSYMLWDAYCPATLMSQFIGSVWLFLNGNPYE
jgi:hypothetical protein